jgi:hypothetical protein
MLPFLYTRRLRLEKLYDYNIMCLPEIIEWFRKKQQPRRNFRQFFTCSCDICDSNFIRLDDLIEHMTSHETNELNRKLLHGYGTVRCNKCWISFNSVADLHDHQCVQNNVIIDGLSPIQSHDSLDSVVIHE